MKEGRTKRSDDEVVGLVDAARLVHGELWEGEERKTSGHSLVADRQLLRAREEQEKTNVPGTRGDTGRDVPRQVLHRRADLLSVQ